jgi:hypothetical protein
LIRLNDIGFRVVFVPPVPAVLPHKTLTSWQLSFAVRHYRKAVRVANKQTTNESLLAVLSMRKAYIIGGKRNQEKDSFIFYQTKPHGGLRDWSFRRESPERRAPKDIF